MSEPILKVRFTEEGQRKDVRVVTRSNPRICAIVYLAVASFLGLYINADAVEKILDGIRVAPFSHHQHQRTNLHSETLPTTTPRSEHNSSCTPPPLIIGGGQGTTGTHTMYDATCDMGFASVHWEIDCQNGGNGTRYFNLTKYFRNKNYCLPGETHKDKPRSTNAHYRIQAKFKGMLQCLDTRNMTSEPCQQDFFNDATQWANSIKKDIDQVTKWGPSSGLPVGAVHDTPYSMILPYIIESATRNRGQRPVLLMSERNPWDWVHRRYAKLYVTLCRIDLARFDESIGDDDDIYDTDAIPTFENDLVDDAIYTSHFDWFSCIDRTVKAMATEKNTTASSIQVSLDRVFVDLKHVWTRYPKFPEDKVIFSDALMHHAAYSFAKHQKYWKSRADFTVNMFEQENVTARSIAEAFGTFLWKSTQTN